MEILKFRQIWENKHLIAQGIVNMFFSPKELKQLAKKRQSICKTCPANSHLASGDKKYNVPFWHCTKCGCSLNIKPYAQSATCPLRMW